MNTFGLNIVASDKDFYHGRGTSIMLPGGEGTISILAHHADMMVAIVPGEMRFKPADSEEWKTAIGKRV